MVPLLKAMRMPRVSLLLADDVGLGKTVEAGLILSELVLQRRIQRILILTPASLRKQWQQEMHEKFCLQFDIVDRPQTTQLRRRLGLDANPWRASPHVIASYHYLKQPDVLEDFLATCRVPEGSPHLPWDLIIVDEAHNLAPAAFGEDSDLSSMLRRIAPQFEHKIFATATPHNGRTRCFSGLLEILDPARFSQTSEFTSAERARVQEVVVRRLKSEINAVTNPPRFSERHLGSPRSSDRVVKALQSELTPVMRSLNIDVSSEESLPDYRNAHFVILGSHGRADNADGFSRLSDDEQDYEPDRVAAALAGSTCVVLFVCHGGRGDEAMFSHETTGLTSSLLRHGVRTVVAALWPVEVTIVTAWLEEFGKTNANDLIVERVDQAQRAMAKRQAFAEITGENPLVRCTFTVFGDGCHRIGIPERQVLENATEEAVGAR